MQCYRRGSLAMAARESVTVRARDGDRPQRECWERNLAAYEFHTMPSESLLRPEPKFPVCERLGPREHNQGKDPRNNAFRRSCEILRHVIMHFSQAALK